MQQFNFTGNLNRDEDVNDNTLIFFMIEEGKQTILDFSQGTVKVDVSATLFCLNIISIQNDSM